MYSVGSLADLISGSNTPNKPAVQLQAVAPSPFKTKKSPAKLPNQKTANDAETPETRKTENKDEPEKENAETTENKDTPQKRKLKDDNKAKKRRPKKVKTGRNLRPVKRNTDSALNRSVEKGKVEGRDRADQEECTVFVGNVPITADIKQLKRFFALYGVVETLRIRGVPAADPKLSKKVALIKKKFHAGRKSVQCYVVYKTVEDAIKALEANGKEFKGHHLIVNKADTHGEHDQKKAIFIGNLPFNAEEDDVWSLFQDCGDIVSVRLVRDKQTRMGKGFGYVNFTSADAVELALQMDDVLLNKRTVRVSRCKESKGAGQTKKTVDGTKIRKSPRPPTTESTETGETMTEKEVHIAASKPAQFQGTKFTDKRKKKRLNRNELKKKKISKILTSAA